MRFPSIIAFLVLFHAASPRFVQAQVLVETIDPGGVASEAGLRPDDELTSWERPRGDTVVARGVFRRPFDARDFEIEQLARGPARITIRRGGVVSTVRVRSGFWGLEPGLILPDPILNVRFKEGLAHARARRVQAALDIWRPLAEQLRARRQLRSAIWLDCRMAKLMIAPLWVGADDSGDWQQGKGVNAAQDLIADAAGLAKRLGDLKLEGMVWESGGLPWQMDYRWGYSGRMSGGRVRKLFANALALRQRSAQGSLLVAVSARSLGLVWAAVDDPAVPPDFAKARRYARLAVDITSRDVPGSFADAVAKVAYARVISWGHAKALVSAQEYERAAHYLREAVAVTLQTGPARERTAFAEYAAFALSGYGLNTDAARCFRIVLEAWDPKRPSVTTLDGAGDGMGGNTLALLHADLGATVSLLGRLDEAEQLYQQALREATDDTERGLALYNLAGLAGQRGDRVRERQWLLELLAVRKPDDTEMLTRLADVALTAGNFSSAAAFLRGAVATLDAALPKVAVAPDQANRVMLEQEGDPARRQANRADVCQAMAKLITSREATSTESARFERECLPGVSEPTYLPYSRALLASGKSQQAAELASSAVRLARRKRATAWRGELASALLHLGRARCESNELKSGLAALKEAKAEYDRISSRAPEYLETLTAIGMCSGKAGQPQDAVKYLKRAVEMADAAPDSRRRSVLARSFRTAQWWEAYSALASALVDLGRAGEAFETLERGRAQAFTLSLTDRTQSAERLSGELAQHQKALWFEYDRAQKRLEGGDATALTRLQVASARLDAFESRVRHARLSQTAATANALRSLPAALGSSTLLLEYSIGPHGARVFVVEPSTPVQVTLLDIGAAQLEVDVATFRAAIARGEPADSGSEIRVRGSRLYSALLGPLESVINRYERVVVVPDGPLHDLPFPALTRAGPTDGQYLVAWRPFHIAPSAATYALMLGTPRVAGRGVVVAVGGALASAGVSRVARTRAEDAELLPPGDEEDPAAEDGAGDDERGPAGGALPGSRLEVAAIADVMGPGVTTLLDAEAEESRVKQVAPRARILHFATHAVVNNAMPLNGGLRLSPPRAGSTEDGFLQAWEVIEQVSMSADLVTLSACDSAYGRRIAGEGLMSLARAFHLAGARSVVSTLWTIDDRASVDLMREFYQGLKQGLAKDEALRRAQLRFVTSRGNARWRAPKYWAAFQLSGDWR